MFNYKGRFKIVEEKDLLLPQNMDFTNYVGRECPDDCFVIIPAICRKEFFTKDAEFLAKERLRFKGYTETRTAIVLTYFSMLVNSYRFHLANLPPGITPYNYIKNEIFVPQDSFYWNGSDENEKTFKKKLERSGYYMIFKEHKESYNLNYEDMRLFFKEIELLKDTSFVIQKGSFLTEKMTTLSYTGTHNDTFFLQMKDFLVPNSRRKMKKFYTLLACQVVAETLSEGNRYIREVRQEREGKPVLYRENYSSKDFEGTEIEKIHTESSKDFLRYDQETAFLSKYFGYNPLGNQRIFRGPLLGGRGYGPLTFLQRSRREKLLVTSGLVECDLVAAQLQMLNHMSFCKYGFKYDSDDLYFEVFKNIKDYDEFKDYYEELRPFVKIGIMPSINEEDRPKEVSQYFVLEAIAESGLLYHKAEKQATSQLIRDLKDPKIKEVLERQRKELLENKEDTPEWYTKFSDISACIENCEYENPYKAPIYGGLSKENKEKRVDRFANQSRYNPKHIKTLEKNFNQKQLYRFSFQIYDAFIATFTKNLVEEFRGALDIIESNSLFYLLAFHKEAIFGVHDCFYCTPDKAEELTNKFKEYLENEVERYCSNSITLNYKKALRIKPIYERDKTDYNLEKVDISKYLLSESEYIKKEIHKLEMSLFTFSTLELENSNLFHSNSEIYKERLEELKRIQKELVQINGKTSKKKKKVKNSSKKEEFKEISLENEFFKEKSEKNKKNWIFSNEMEIWVLKLSNSIPFLLCNNKRDGIIEDFIWRNKLFKPRIRKTA